MRDNRFERMYIEHRDRLFGFLVYRTGDRALAEDLVGDVFERVLRARVPFDARRGSETTWLYAIALNRLRDHYRSASAERRALERYGVGDLVPADPPDGRLAERDQVMRSLAILSPEEREVIALRFGADLTSPQIARATGKPLTTVEGRLYRALRRLRAALGPEAVDGARSAPVPAAAPPTAETPVSGESDAAWRRPATGLV